MIQINDVGKRKIWKISSEDSFDQTTKKYIASWCKQTLLGLVAPSETLSKANYFETKKIMNLS